MIALDIGDGLRVMLVERRHADSFWAMVERNRGDWVNRMPFVSKTRSVIELEVVIQRFLDKFAAGTGAFYGIFRGSEMVGLVLVRDSDLEARWAEIGYLMDGELQGRGIITRVCRLLIAHLFEERGLHRLLLCCDVRNQASQAVARKLGFRHEGTLRQDMVVNGQYIDRMWWGLLASEWEAAQGR